MTAIEVVALDIDIDTTLQPHRHAIISFPVESDSYKQSGFITMIIPKRV